MTARSDGKGGGTFRCVRSACPPLWACVSPRHAIPQPSPPASTRGRGRREGGRVASLLDDGSRIPGCAPTHCFVILMDPHRTGAWCLVFPHCASPATLSPPRRVVAFAAQVTVLATGGAHRGRHEHIFTAAQCNRFEALPRKVTQSPEECKRDAKKRGREGDWSKVGGGGLFRSEGDVAVERGQRVCSDSPARPLVQPPHGGGRDHRAWRRFQPTNGSEEGRSTLPAPGPGAGVPVHEQPRQRHGGRARHVRPPRVPPRQHGVHAVPPRGEGVTFLGKDLGANPHPTNGPVFFLNLRSPERTHVIPPQSHLTRERSGIFPSFPEFQRFVNIPLPKVTFSSPGPRTSPLPFSTCIWHFCGPPVRWPIFLNMSDRGMRMCIHISCAHIRMRATRMYIWLCVCIYVWIQTQSKVPRDPRRVDRHRLPFQDTDRSAAHGKGIEAPGGGTSIRLRPGPTLLASTTPARGLWQSTFVAVVSSRK